MTVMNGVIDDIYTIPDGAGLLASPIGRHAIHVGHDGDYRRMARLSGTMGKGCDAMGANDRPACRDCGSTTRKLTLVGPRAGWTCGACARDRRLARAANAHASRIAGRYDLSAVDFERMVVAQDGQCALCGRGKDGWVGQGRKRHRLSIDHDHKTGRVRGLVCSPCNDYLGYVGDNADVFKRGFRYLWGESTAERLGIVAIAE